MAAVEAVIVTVRETAIALVAAKAGVVVLVS